LLEPSDLSNAQVGVQLLPPVKGHICHPHLPGDLLMGVPDEACRKAKAICAGVKRFFMRGSSSPNDGIQQIFSSGMDQDTGSRTYGWTPLYFVRSYPARTQLLSQEAE
jgi:hypothetical protein